MNHRFVLIYLFTVCLSSCRSLDPGKIPEIIDRLASKVPDEVESAKKELLCYGRIAVPALLKSGYYDREFINQLKFSDERYRDNILTRREFKKTKINFICDSTRLDYALAYITGLTNRGVCVTFCLDPELQDNFKDKGLSFKFKDLTLYQAAEEIVKATGLEYDIRFGMVIFSSVKRLFSVYLEHEGAIDRQQNVGPKYRSALLKHTHLNPATMHPADVLYLLSEKCGIKIDIKESANLLKGSPIAPKFACRLVDILKFITRSYGDDFVLQDGVVVIMRCDREHGIIGD